MYKKNNILVIIMARGGSKGIVKKNTKLLAGKPLVCYALQAAKNSTLVDRIIVSTDSKDIADIARGQNIEVPFMRPSYLAKDTTPSLPVIKHALDFLKKSEKYTPSLVVIVQPTSPLVIGKDIDTSIRKVVQQDVNSCISLCEISERPEAMYHVNVLDKIRPYIKNKAHNTYTRQSLPKIFRANGAVYITKPSVIKKKNTIIDKANAAAYIMPKERSVDIDDEIDFSLAEVLLKKHYAKYNMRKR